MLANKYLYGEDVDVPEIPQEVVVRRLELLKENLEELLGEPYAVRDGKRCNAIIRAIHFWDNINEEDK